MRAIPLSDYSIVNSQSHIFGISQNMELNIKIKSPAHKEFIFNTQKRIIYAIHCREGSFFESWRDWFHIYRVESLMFRIFGIGRIILLIRYYLIYVG
jgi:hypothetical protein